MPSHNPLMHSVCTYLMHIDDQNFLQLTSKALQHSQATVIMPIYRKCWPHLQHFKRSEVRDILQYVHGPSDPGLTAGSHITTAAINERNGKKTGKKKKKRQEQMPYGSRAK